jgi:hypothetical protein
MLKRRRAGITGRQGLVPGAGVFQMNLATSASLCAWEVDRRLMNADPANATRDVNLIGSPMGQLRTANKRRNRAIRLTVARERMAANALAAGETTGVVKTAANSAKAVS